MVEVFNTWEQSNSQKDLNNETYEQPYLCMMKNVLNI